MTVVETCCFRVTVTVSDDPPIWRDLEVVGGSSLYALAEAIIAAFGFDFDHAFGFYSGKTYRTMTSATPKYELFADLEPDSDAQSVKKTSVSTAFVKSGQRLTFLFDYGDEWLFEVKLIRIGEKVGKTKYPRLLGSCGDAPIQYPAEDEDET